MNFWDTLLTHKPIVGLSPMDGVTDAPMRYMTAKYGRPHVVFTEFVSVDALRYAKNPEAVDRLMRAFIRTRDVGPLEHTPYEVAQVFGHTPELFYQAAVIIATLGYDGMDINMGCPAHNVQESGSGAGLIRTPEIAQQIVREAKRGMADYAAGTVRVDDLDVSEAVKEWVKKNKPTNQSTKASKNQSVKALESQNARRELPVSVKTRLGVDSIVVKEWMETLMEVEPAMISLHGRTLKQLYQGEANWEAIGKAAEVVHSLGGHILGNGDIQSIQDLRNKIQEYGVDGGLIGRAAEGNPGIFTGEDDPSWEERKRWMLEHAEIYERINKPENWDGVDNRWFVPMRKHLAWYCKGFPGAGGLRERLVRTNNHEDLLALLVD